MDTTAVTLCMENDIPILVLNLWEPEALIRGILGEPVGTLVSSDDGATWTQTPIESGLTKEQWMIVRLCIYGGVAVLILAYVFLA